MTTDLKGVALVIAAVCTGIAAVVGPIVTAYLQIKASKKADANKVEAVAARAQTETNIMAGQNAIHDDLKTVVAAVAAPVTPLPGASP
jgi:hypothetical protein